MSNTDRPSSEVIRPHKYGYDGTGPVECTYTELNGLKCSRSEADHGDGSHHVYDYPETNSGPLCRAEESGYLDRTGEDIFCPFGSPEDDYKCTSECTSNRARVCITGP